MLQCFGQFIGPVPLNAALARTVWVWQELGPRFLATAALNPLHIFGDSLRVKVLRSVSSVRTLTGFGLFPNWQSQRVSLSSQALCTAAQTGVVLSLLLVFLPFIQRTFNGFDKTPASRRLIARSFSQFSACAEPK